MLAYLRGVRQLLRMWRLNFKYRFQSHVLRVQQRDPQWRLR